MTLDMEKMRALSLQGLRDCIAEGRMTQEKWNKLRPETRAAVRDTSDLHPLLMGLEGWRVEAIMPDASTVSGYKPRRFIVGRTTGWRPCHLAVKRITSRGSSETITAATVIRSVRKLERVR